MARQNSAIDNELKAFTNHEEAFIYGAYANDQFQQRIKQMGYNATDYIHSKIKAPSEIITTHLYKLKEEK